MPVDQIDQSDDVLPAAVNDNVRKSSLALIAVLDPAAVVDRELVQERDGLLLGRDRSDPADLSLVVERYIYIL